MNAETDRGMRPSRYDAVGIVLFIVAGAAIAVWTIVTTVQRIVAVLSGAPTRVAVEFLQTTATVPMGPGGADYPVEIDRGWIEVPQLPVASVGAAVLEPLVFAATVLVAIACLVLLSRNILRGRVFSRGNTALVTGAGLTGIIGFALSRFFGNMVANGAVAVVSDRGFDGNAVMSIEPLPWVLGAFALAIVSTVFVVGDRLQRETEGLV